MYQLNTFLLESFAKSQALSAAGGSGRVAGLHVLCSFLPVADGEPRSPAAALQLCLSQPLLLWLKLSLNLNLLYPNETGKAFLTGLDMGQNPREPVAVSDQLSKFIPFASVTPLARAALGCGSRTSRHRFSAGSAFLWVLGL